MITSALTSLSGSIHKLYCLLASYLKLALMLALSVGYLSFAQSVSADEFLDPAVAFKVDAKMVAKDKLRIDFTVAKGYYLYRERFKFAAEGASLGQFEFPRGTIKYDETFEKDVETYHDQMTIEIPVVANADFTLKLTQQGCADAGLCYPPMDQIGRAHV